MPVRAATYQQVALEEPESKWELVCRQQLPETPPTSTEHRQVAR